jgi:hypothetical protein
MANVMTPSFTQAELVHALTHEIGHNWRKTGAYTRPLFSPPT